MEKGALWRLIDAAAALPLGAESFPSLRDCAAPEALDAICGSGRRSPTCLVRQYEPQQLAVAVSTLLIQMPARCLAIGAPPPHP